MDVVELLNEEWNTFLNQDNKLKIMFETNGVFDDFVFKNVNVDFAIYHDIVDMPRNQVLGNYKIVIDYKGDSINMNILEYCSVKVKADMYEEFNHRKTILVDGYLKDLSRPRGKKLREVFDLSEEEEKRVISIMLVEFGIVNKLWNFFKENFEKFCKENNI